SATQAVNVSMTGGSSVISGSGTISFNTIEFNHTGTTTVSRNLTVNNTLSIINTGTVSAGAFSITGAGASNTFQMTTGWFAIGGTATFPSGFETISLTGGTVHYAGLAQVVAYQESDGGALVYNNVQFSESAGGTNNKTFGGNVDINGSVTLESGV